MQEVLIDITRLIHRFMNKRLATGVDRVSLAYIRHYRDNARAVYRHKSKDKFVFRKAESAVLFDWVLALGVTGNPQLTIYKGLLTGCLAQNVAGRFLFNTGHTGLESDDYVEMLKSQQVRPIFMVHDLIPLTHPQFCRAGEEAKHLQRLYNCVRAASGVVCNSQATLDGLTSLCSTHGWAMPPTAVALLAPELPEPARGVAPLEGPYFVFVSTIEPRKNHLMVLQLWEKLVAHLGDAAPKLVIIGQRGWDYEEVTMLLENSALLKGKVLEVSRCSDAEMVSYLQHSRALLFPSFTEGYGMPVVEALTLGVPVIASDLPVFREFAGQVPDYIDVMNELGWFNMICDFTQAGSLARLDQLRRLEGYQAPTWRQHFEKVDALLRQLDLQNHPHESSVACVQ
ncbi:MAG: glycosyltransferase family 4 protein [Polaromonas sp.]